MGPFLKKLDRLLRAGFDGATTELENFKTDRKVGGFLIWDGFVGVDMTERVRSIWALFERELPRPELKWITLIMPFTPAEMVVRREELARDENKIQRAARVGIS